MRKLHLLGSLKYLMVLMLLILTFYPLFYMVMTSFKSMPQFYHDFWAPSWPPQFGNYAVAWRQLKGYVANSLYITVLGTVGTVMLCSLSAFAFARVDFKFKNALFYAVIILMMVPSILVLIPLFMWTKTLGLLNSREGVILSYIALGQPFGVFLLRSFFSELPQELFASARIDGASFSQTYRYIGMPLSLNIIGTLSVINVLYIWNDYLWPSVVLSAKDLKPITTGLMVYFGQYNVQYGFLMAGCVIAALPLIVLFFFTMKYFIAGIMSGALKM